MYHSSQVLKPRANYLRWPSSTPFQILQLSRLTDSADQSFILTILCPSPLSTLDPAVLFRGFWLLAFHFRLFNSLPASRAFFTPVRSDPGPSRYIYRRARSWPLWSTIFPLYTYIIYLPQHPTLSPDFSSSPHPPSFQHLQIFNQRLPPSLSLPPIAIFHLNSPHS